ncbi:hypothetical protein ACEPAI_9229 [Sanghuangporus weigelae]
MLSILRSFSRLSLHSRPQKSFLSSLDPHVHAQPHLPSAFLQVRTLTLNQATRRKPKRKIKQSVSVALEGNYQRKGVCTQIFTMKPKKPNSANRKVARVKLSNGNTVIAFIQGEGHNLQEHSVVLVRGGRAQDLPGVRYKIVRGAFDLGAVVNRRTARSRYGVIAKKPKTK